MGILQRPQCQLHTVQVHVDGAVHRNGSDRRAQDGPRCGWACDSDGRLDGWPLPLPFERYRTGPCIEGALIGARMGYDGDERAQREEAGPYL